MPKYITRTLLTRGGSHELHCEDDLFTFEDNTWIVAAVFDGCSSGIDSHYASTCHKYRLKSSLRSLNQYYEENSDLESVSKSLLLDVYIDLHSEDYKSGEEMLSTIVLLLIHKHTKHFHILFAGDGVCQIGDDIRRIHDSSGDTVWYISTIHKKKDFDEYYDKCPKFKGYELPKEIIISTDGIDSFKDVFGVNRSDEAYDILFKSDRFLQQEIMLKRLYNIMTKSDTPCRNQDDLAIIRIIIDNSEDELSDFLKMAEQISVCY